jgi:hypothetical protein
LEPRELLTRDAPDELVCGIAAGEARLDYGAKGRSQRLAE